MQEVFTRVWLNARRFDAGRARGMTWLIAIVRNKALFADWMEDCDALLTPSTPYAAPSSSSAMRRCMPS